MNDRSSPILWWIKRDFRLDDCPALRRALDTGRRVIALWIFEPSQTQAREFSNFHGQAQIQAAQALQAQLQKGHGQLCVVHDEVLPTLGALHKLDPFSQMVSHQEVGTLGTFERDRQVKRWARAQGIQWLEYRQTGVFRALPDRAHRQRFWQAWMREPLARPPSQDELARIRPNTKTQQWLEKTNATKLETMRCMWRSTNSQRVGEKYAKNTLRSFLKLRSTRYLSSISSPVEGAMFGSRISTHLAWGTLSPRRLLRELQAWLHDLDPAQPNAARQQRALEMFRSRIHWRDHFMQRLECSPDLEMNALCPNFAAMLATPQPSHFQAWVEGKTGFPLVDACIRCAQHTGFLNFRMRAMITSTACHILRIPWQEIGWVMAQWWADYEPGIHWAQLQMQAGMTGINANRIYDPQTQLRRLDPHAQFVKRWLPELGSYPAQAIIHHHQMPLTDYPAPRKHWAQARERWRIDYAKIASQRDTRTQQREVLQRHGSRGASPSSASSPRAQRSSPSNTLIKLPVW